MKKHFFLLFLLALLPMLAMADDSGSCGENVTWTYIEADHTLTIKGSGAMSDYDWGTTPWYDYREQITTVMIDDGVTSIGDKAFSDCSGLTSVTIGNSLTSIGEYAFQGCSGLTSVTIPNSVTSIGRYAFSYCSGLTSVTIPNSVTSIGDNPFDGCSGLTSVIVENGNNKYDSRNNCNAIIETATNELIVGCSTTVIPNSVTAIGRYAFYYCKGLTSVDIPNSVTSIGEYAFQGCSGLTSIDIPNSVTSIGKYAFYDCSGLTSVTIPNSVTSIGSSAFEECSGLTSVTIPNSVTSIGALAFAYCSNLTTVNAMMTNPPESKYAFGNDENIYQKAALYVPVGCKDIYSNTEGWKRFVNIEELGDKTVVKEDVNEDGKVNALDIQQVINVAAASE